MQWAEGRTCVAVAENPEALLEILNAGWQVRKLNANSTSDALLFILGCVAHVNNLHVRAVLEVVKQTLNRNALELEQLSDRTCGLR